LAVCQLRRGAVLALVAQPGLRNSSSILSALVAHYGWPDLGERIPVRCFLSDPSIKSSLAFLRRTPWAREKIEGLYLFMLRDLRRNA
jgi:uncharacterized protein (DUF2132 family)